MSFRQSSVGPASPLHSITSLIKKLPTSSQGVSASSNSFTVRLLDLMGARSMANRRPMTPSGSKQHKVELKRLVVRAVGVVDDKIGAALVALRLEFVQLDRDRALLGVEWSNEAKQRTRQSNARHQTGLDSSPHLTHPPVRTESPTSKPHRRASVEVLNFVALCRCDLLAAAPRPILDKIATALVEPSCFL